MAEYSFGSSSKKIRRRRVQVLDDVSSYAKWERVFTSRKQTLMQKAYELEISTGVEVSITVHTRHGDSWCYATTNELYAKLVKSRIILNDCIRVENQTLCKNLCRQTGLTAAMLKDNSAAMPSNNGIAAEPCDDIQDWCRKQGKNTFKSGSVTGKPSNIVKNAFAATVTNKRSGNATCPQPNKKLALSVITSHDSPPSLPDMLPNDSKISRKARGTSISTARATQLKSTPTTMRRSQFSKVSNSTFATGRQRTWNGKGRKYNCRKVEETEDLIIIDSDGEPGGINDFTTDASLQIPLKSLPVEVSSSDSDSDSSSSSDSDSADSESDELPSVSVPVKQDSKVPAKSSAEPPNKNPYPSPKLIAGTSNKNHDFTPTSKAEPAKKNSNSCPIITAGPSNKNSDVSTKIAAGPSNKNKHISLKTEGEPANKNLNSPIMTAGACNNNADVPTKTRARPSTENSHIRPETTADPSSKSSNSSPITTAVASNKKPDFSPEITPAPPNTNSHASPKMTAEPSNKDFDFAPKSTAASSNKNPDIFHKSAAESSNKHSELPPKLMSVTSTSNLKSSNEIPATDKPSHEPKVEPNLYEFHFAFLNPGMTEGSSVGSKITECGTRALSTNKNIDSHKGLSANQSGDGRNQMSSNMPNTVQSFADLRSEETTDTKQLQPPETSSRETINGRLKNVAVSALKKDDIENSQPIVNSGVKQTGSNHSFKSQRLSEHASVAEMKDTNSMLTANSERDARNRNFDNFCLPEKVTEYDRRFGNVSVDRRQDHRDATPQQRYSRSGHPGSVRARSSNSRHRSSSRYDEGWHRRDRRDARSPPYYHNSSDRNSYRSGRHREDGVTPRRCYRYYDRDFFGD